MGATQSKKHRKERKRRRKQYDGPSSGHFDVPRSISLDALRSYGVASSSSSTAASNCAHCGGWTWSGNSGRAERRTFSGLLESSGVCHGFHRCIRGQYEDMQGAGAQLRGYDSDDDAGRWSSHTSCLVCSLDISQENMTSHASSPMHTQACPGPEHSTMSLNRLEGFHINSKISQTRSSEFSELFGILSRHEKIRASFQKPGSPNFVSLKFRPSTQHSSSSALLGNVASPITLPDQSNRVAVSSTALNTVEAPAISTPDTKSPTPPPTQVLELADQLPANNEKLNPTITISTNIAATSTTTSNTAGTNTSAKINKPLTVLEDKETRLARWEKQKLMAEQLRLLRKHLLARETKKNTTGISEELLPSLKGPIDADEPYLSLQSHLGLNSDMSEQFDWTHSNTNSLQSLPNAPFSDSQISSHVQHSQISLNSLSDKQAVKTPNEGQHSAQSQTSFIILSQAISNSSTIDRPVLSSSQQTQHLSDFTSSHSQALQSRSKFKRQGQNFRNLDNHPVLSRLQNEQNSRLERMERKMRCIRASAEQAAERKKFKQIFPARQEVLVEDEKQRMKEAEETLAKLKEENQRKKQIMKAFQCKDPQRDLLPSISGPATETKTIDSRSSDDSGEVIPVHVLAKCSDLSISPSSNSGSLLLWKHGSNKKVAIPYRTESDEYPQQDVGKKQHWLYSTFSQVNMDLGNPLSWLVLPFLLFPLFLRLLLSLALNSKPQTVSTVSRSPSPSPTSSVSTWEQAMSEVTQEENSLIRGHQSLSRTETRILSKKCGSKVPLQRVGSSEVLKFKSL